MHLTYMIHMAFVGTSALCGHTGIAHLTFNKSGSHYTWRKVTTTVHNIIVGRLWVDNQGEMDITNHTTGDKCHLKYSAYSYFSREPPRKVGLD